MNWLNIYKHLLPNARAWRLTIDKPLRRFFQGLAGLPEGVVNYQDAAWNNLRPQETGSLSDWECQFALPSTGLTEQQRRDRLDAAWKALGGQSPRYIQDTLQAAGFDVYVHEWWEPIPGRETGGSLDGDVTPTARNPLLYLDDGTGGPRFLMQDGAAQDGNSDDQDGRTATPNGYPLVNKVQEVSNPFIGDGVVFMRDGDAQAQDGKIQSIYSRKQYIMPADPNFWPYFLYIGSENFPENAFIPNSRRDEFEDLCLKICPNEQWLGILVTYT